MYTAERTGAMWSKQNCPRFKLAARRTICNLHVNVTRLELCDVNTQILETIHDIKDVLMCDHYRNIAF